MSRPQIDARIRAAQQPPVSRARPPVDIVPPNQRAGTERTATALVPQNAPSRAPPLPRQTGQFSRPPAIPATERTGAPRVAPESVGAIALPRPPVQAPGNPQGMSRPPVSRAAPVPPGTVRTTGSIARKTGSLPPTPTYGSQPPPRSAEPPPLDDLVPRSRSERPRHTRPPVSHRSQPPRDRPRFIDRSPEPRSPGGGLPGPDSFGRLPAPIQRYEPKPGEFPSPSQFPAPNPEETMAMARGPYAAPPPQMRAQTAEYYPAPQPQPPPHQTSRSYAPPPADTYRDRDPNEYYPHLSGPSHAPMPPHMANASASYDRYPPPGYLPPADPRARTLPASAIPSSISPASNYPPAMQADSRLPMPGSAPYPYVAPPIENPSFMGLVLFAAPLALATLAVAFLALM